jgi:hypothetical protein
MEESLASLHAKFDSFGTQLAKIDVLEKTISNLLQENTIFLEELQKKDAIIDQLTEKVNRLEQSMRVNSVRIHGLPVNSDTPASQVPNIVYREIILPIFEVAKQSGDLPPTAEPVLHFTLVNAFAIPAKKNAPSSPVIVKFFSEFIRGLVFKHKRAALPTTTDLSSTPSSAPLLTTPELKAQGSLEDKYASSHEDRVYKATSLLDTYDKLVSSQANPQRRTPLGNT